MALPANTTVELSRQLLTTFVKSSHQFTRATVQDDVDDARRVLLDYTFDFVNSTARKTRIEVLPLWTESIKIWSWVWSLHKYLIATIFLSLTIYSSIALIMVVLKYKSHNYLTLILTLLSSTGILKSVYYFVDPYSFHRSFSPILNRLLLEFSKPTLITAYASLHILVLKLTQLDVGSNIAHAPSFVLVMFLLQCILTTSVEVTVTRCGGIRGLLLLNNGFFIVWSISLCVVFIYNGFQLTHYTSEVHRALKDLEAFSQHRKSDSEEGKASVRISKSRIKVTNEQRRTCSILPDTADSDSDHCPVPLSHATRDKPDVVQTDDASITAMSSSYMASQEENAKTHSNFKQKFRFKHRPRRFSDVCDTTSKCSVGNKLKSFLHINSIDDMLKENLWTMSPETSENFDCILRRNTAEMTTSFSRQTDVSFAGLSDNSGCEEDKKSVALDAGYMADTDSTKASYSKYTNWKRMETGTDTHSLKQEIKYDMPKSTSTLSLSRIRQSKMLHRVVCYGYSATFVGFVMCLLELYTVFSSYGILGRPVAPHPWPWIAFQTFKRLVEFAMALAVSLATYEVIRYRLQRSTIRRARLKSRDRTRSP